MPFIILKVKIDFYSYAFDHFEGQNKTRQMYHSQSLIQIAYNLSKLLVFDNSNQSLQQQSSFLRFDISQTFIAYIVSGAVESRYNRTEKVKFHSAETTKIRLHQRTMTALELVVTRSSQMQKRQNDIHPTDSTSKHKAPIGIKSSTTPPPLQLPHQHQSRP